FLLKAILNPVSHLKSGSSTFFVLMLSSSPRFFIDPTFCMTEEYPLVYGCWTFKRSASVVLSYQSKLSVTRLNRFISNPILNVLAFSQVRLLFSSWKGTAALLPEY